MADIKISELTAVSSLNNDDLVEVSQVNALAPSGYTSLKATMRDIGSKVNKDIEYTTDLADFTDKTIVGAIKETAKGKNVADEYDDTQTYDKGDVVIYKNTLYICTTNNTTGTWDATKWTATTVQSLIGDLSQLTTSVKSSLVGAVNDLDHAKANKATTLAGYGITNAYTKTEVDNANAKRYTTLWGTTCQTTIGRAQFLVLTNRILYVVWLASTNDINVANISSNTYQSGTGNVTLDNNVFTRLSNNNLKVQLSGSGTITIFG